MPDITGTTGDDVLVGTDANDILTGVGGADRLSGGRGNDVLDGGDGDDVLDGGEETVIPITPFSSAFDAGGDYASYRAAANGVTVTLLIAGAQDTGQGRDTLIGIENLYGSAFNDVLTGDDRNNIIQGRAGADTLRGGDGDDALSGGDGNDHLDGGAGNDALSDGAGDDVMIGGDGNDTLWVSHLLGRDQVLGGAGDDTVRLSGDRVSFGVVNELLLDGGDGTDLLVLQSGEVEISGFSAANGFERFRGSGFVGSGTFVGTSGDDLFDFSSLTSVPYQDFSFSPPQVSILRARGGAGRDTMIGMAGEGFDYLSGEAGDDVLRGMGGNDNLDGGAGNDHLEGGDGNDRLSGGDGNDVLLGGQGDDVIDGGLRGGTDRIDGGDGNDHITVGGAASVLQGGAGIDTLTFANGGATLSSFSAANGFERFAGHSGGFSLDGTINADVLDFSGLTGADAGVILSVQAGLGNDIISGLSDAGNSFIGQGGDDILTGGSVEDRLFGSEGADQIYGGGGNDTLNGGEGDDKLFGGAGDDLLQGGTGVDVLDGGAGQDAVVAESFQSLVASLALGTATYTGGSSTLISIENLTGAGFGDSLTGDDGTNSLMGMGGSDTLSGGGGADYLDGGQGDDQAEGGAGDDTLVDIQGYDTAVFNYAFAQARISFANGILNISGPEGTDRLTGFERLKFSDGFYYVTTDGSVAPSNNPITGTPAADTLTGTPAADTIAGGAGNDTLNGGDGDDYLLGEAGNDILNGGRGNDYLFGGAGNDTYTWRWENGTGRTTIRDQEGLDTLDLSGLSLAEAENLTIVTGALADGFEVRARLADGNVTTVIDANRVLRLVGSSGVDRYQLNGSTVGYEINSGAGNDRITGGLVRDFVNAGNGDDVIGNSAGGDFIDGGAGTDTLLVAGLSRAYSIISIGAGSSLVEITGENRANATRITSVENVAFVDGVRTFDPTSSSAQVMRLYKAALDRNPDQPGLEHNVAALSTVSLSTLAGYFVNSAEFQARFGSLSNQQFIEQLYVFALGRQGDVQGINLWVARLDAGTSRGDVLLGFSESAEHLARTASILSAGLWIPDQEALSIARLYDAALNRLPDAPGLAGWVGLYDNGMSLSQIAGYFVSSPEFEARYGTLSNQAFVEQLYRFCLDRDGDAPGIEGWVNLLNSGASRASVLLGFSESPEHIALTAPLWSGGVRYLGSAGAPPVDAGAKHDDVQAPPLIDQAQVYDPGDLHLAPIWTQETKQGDAFVLPADPDWAFMQGAAPSGDPANGLALFEADVRETEDAPTIMLRVEPFTDDPATGLLLSALDLAWA